MEGPSMKFEVFASDMRNATGKALQKQVCSNSNGIETLLKAARLPVQIDTSVARSAPVMAHSKQGKTKTKIKTKEKRAIRKAMAPEAKRIIQEHVAQFDLLNEFANESTGLTFGQVMRNDTKNPRTTFAISSPPSTSVPSPQRMKFCQKAHAFLRL